MSFAGRTKVYFVEGIDADDNGVALAQALSLAADGDALSLDQAVDVAVDVNDLAAAQNPNNALDTNAFALAQNYATGVPLSLEAGAAAISPRRRASFTSATDESGTNFTIVGTGVDPAGAVVTGEVVAGPNNTTVNSVNAYSAITSITPDATEAVDTIEVGFPAYLDATLTLEAVAAALIPPRNISLTSGAAADFSGVGFTVTGTDPDGAALVETITVGPNNNSVSTTGFFSAVTSIALNPTDDSVDADLSAGWLANSVPFALRLNGALGNGLGAVSDVFAAAPVTVQSGENVSGITFAIVGLGTNGLALSETITGPNNTTVTSANPFTRVDSITPSDDSGAGASSVTAGIGAAVAQSGMTLEAGAADLDPPRRLSFDASGDISTIVFTITGTDRWGNPIVETLTGVTTTPVVTKAAFASVESITFDAATTETVFVGWPIGGQTPWVLCGRGFGHDQKPECAISVLATAGSADGEVEVTFDEFVDLDETEIDVDKTTAITPGTPVFEKGEGVRFVLTTGAGTTAKVKFTRAGP